MGSKIQQWSGFIVHTSVQRNLELYLEINFYAVSFYDSSQPLPTPISAFLSVYLLYRKMLNGIENIVNSGCGNTSSMMQVFLLCPEHIKILFIYRRPTLYPLEIAVDFFKSP
jgi:hypothetical protein